LASDPYPPIGAVSLPGNWTAIKDSGPPRGRCQGSCLVDLRNAETAANKGKPGNMSIYKVAGGYRRSKRREPAPF